MGEVMGVVRGVGGGGDGGVMGGKDSFLKLLPVHHMSVLYMSPPLSCTYISRLLPSPLLLSTLCALNYLTSQDLCQRSSCWCLGDMFKIAPWDKPHQAQQPFFSFFYHTLFLVYNLFSPRRDYHRVHALVLEG